MCSILATARDLSNGLRNKCKATLTRLGGHTVARSTREQLIHDQRELGVVGQVTDGCDGAGPERGSGRAPPAVSSRPPPRSRRTATPPTADGPTLRADEYGTSVQIMVGRLLGPERHSRYLVGKHRNNLSVPGYGRPSVVSVQAKPVNRPVAQGDGQVTHVGHVAASTDRRFRWWVLPLLVE